MNSMRLCGLLVFLCATTNASAAMMVFQDDLAGFNLAAGTPAVALDFESIAPGTNIAGTTISGVSLSSPSGNSLEVVTATSTFTPAGFTGVIDAGTNRLFATSGVNVLSPGGVSLVPGPDPAEQDSLILDFSTPVRAFGFDVLFQSLDTGSNTSFQVFDSSLNQIAGGAVDTSSAGGAGGSPGGAFFLGFVSDDPATDIGRIIVTDSDGNAIFPDSNIGYDTFRIGVVPIPGALWLFGSGLLAYLGLGLKRRA
jgi:hypothetical protein